MKQIGSLLLGALGFIANVVTLITFIFSNNWQVPTVMGLSKWSWAILTALLSFYTISVISALIIQRKRKTNEEKKKGRRSLFEYPEKSTDDGMEFWVHMPFSISVFVLWILTFVEFPPLGNSSELIGVIAIIILMLALLYMIAVLFPMVALTKLMLKFIYE